MLSCACALQNSKRRTGSKLGCRLMAGQRFLVPYVRVRLLPPQPLRFRSAYVAPSSSGLGRRPLKAEVEGSNPFGATKEQQARAFALAFFFSLRRLLAYRTKRGFSLPAVFCFMSQVSKLAVRELDSSRSLRGAKPVRVSLACGVIGEMGTQPCKFRCSRSRMGFRATSKGSRGVHSSRWEPSRR